MTSSCLALSIFEANFIQSILLDRKDTRTQLYCINNAIWRVEFFCLLPLSRICAQHKKKMEKASRKKNTSPLLQMQFINPFGFHKRKISITCFLNYIQVLSKFALKPNIRGNLQVAGRKLISYPEPLSGFPRLLSVRPINMTTYKSNGRGGVNWVINTVAPNFIYTHTQTQLRSRLSFD